MKGPFSKNSRKTKDVISVENCVCCYKEFHISPFTSSGFHADNNQTIGWRKRHMMKSKLQEETELNYTYGRNVKEESWIGELNVINVAVIIRALLRWNIWRVLFPKILERWRMFFRLRSAFAAIRCFIYLHLPPVVSMPTIWGRKWYHRISDNMLKRKAYDENQLSGGHRINLLS